MQYMNVVCLIKKEGEILFCTGPIHPPFAY